MTRKRALLGATIFCLGLLAYFGIFGLRTTRVATVRGLVEGNLRAGESPDEIMHFLEARKLEHSQLIKPEFMTLGGRDYGNQNLIVAIKRDTARAFLWSESIQIIIVFNDRHEMVRADVFPVYSSL
ncbi:MAG: hypothetical protein C5B58_05890 [Acidobacteria bacterium]|nr:MAG: hypothetical protein C5B58_05890 [Acidobacteriota bacterium]